MVRCAGSPPTCPRYLTTLHVLGPVRTHLAALVVSLHNGCIYCAFGHGYALELLYLRDRDRLFPLDARTLRGWLGLEPRELADRMREVLHDAACTPRLWVDQTLAVLRGQHPPVDAAEVRLAHLVAMASR